MRFWLVPFIKTSLPSISGSSTFCNSWHCSAFQATPLLHGLFRLAGLRFAAGLLYTLHWAFSWSTTVPSGLHASHGEASLALRTQAILAWSPSWTRWLISFWDVSQHLFLWPITGKKGRSYRCERFLQCLIFAIPAGRYGSQCSLGLCFWDAWRGQLKCFSGFHRLEEPSQPYRWLGLTRKVMDPCILSNSYAHLFIY